MLSDIEYQFVSEGTQDSYFLVLSDILLHSSVQLSKIHLSVYSPGSCLCDLLKYSDFFGM